MKKDALDSNGDKWALTDGGYAKHDMDEWKIKEKVNKDKGNGYVKKWNWEKENGEKDAHGKKASPDPVHFALLLELFPVAPGIGNSASLARSRKRNSATFC